MPIIDAHVHLYPPEVNRDPAGWAAACGESHWAQLCTRRRKNGQPVQGFPSVKELLNAMDAGGVTRAVLLGWYWERPETCQMQNRFYAQCVQAHPDRLSAFAAIYPRGDENEALGELGIARDSGLIGVGELSPHSQGILMHDPVLAAVLKRAGEWGMPINMHVTDPASRDYPGKIETPLEDFVALARRFPATIFILAHWGGLLPLRGTAALPDNIHYDTAASPLLYGEEIWRKVLAKIPAERVLFGSDYPLNIYPALDAEPGFARFVAEAHRADVSAMRLDAIMGGNARRLLNLPA
ncbi:MAG: amidohydrolase [Opitutaceae bacterium]|jgi:predicted TIM-barrel fold metal-dependent hydrolase|nr:amidohydrolase [Opitutaceae bacterium]